jgi:beta-lactamase class A
MGMSVLSEMGGMRGVPGGVASPPDLVATSAPLLAAAASIAELWRENDATGGFLARNIDTGEQLGFDVDESMPTASVAKVPLALVVLDAIESGDLDGARPITIDPSASYAGSTGLGTFRYPVTIALADLVTQSLTVSDNIAADALLDLVGIGAVNARLRAWRARHILFRHDFRRMFECALGAAGNDFGLAMELAIRGDRPGEVHAIETMNPEQANVATAAALVDLLQRIWTDDIATPAATAGVRERMARQVFQHRLSSDLRTDSFRISAKTGSFLNLRHEVGVVEADAVGGSGARIAIAALSRASVPALVHQGVDLAIGTAARIAVEALR